MKICHKCRTFLPWRSIHHPSTFKETIEKDFEWGYGTKNGEYELIGSFGNIDLHFLIILRAKKMASGFSSGY